jgi:hypothetical protein
MRRFAIAVAFGLLAAACVGQTAPPRSSLPDVATAVEPPRPCQVVVGAGRGVNVDDVVPDSAAVGVLLPGDLVTSLDGVTIQDGDQLRQQISSKAVGDAVEVALIRDGAQLQATVTLGANPDQPDRPLLGVLAVTAFERLEPTELATEQVVSPVTRAIAIGGDVLLLDPVSGHWASTGQTPPQDIPWVSVPEGLFVLEGAGTEEATLVDSTTSTRIEFGLGDWYPSAILGSRGGTVFLSAVRPTAADPALVEVAVMAVDIDAKEALWLWQVTEQGTGIPVTAHLSPNGQRLLVGASNQSGDVIRYIVLEGRQLSIPFSHLEEAEGSLALGWFDDERFLALFGDGTVGFIEVDSGSRSPVDLPGSFAGAARVWTVADGEHVLGDTGSALVRASLTERVEVRPLAENCVLGLVGQPGWGG